jgi:hypothetical protein
MGGYGSGRRFHKKDAADGYLCLNVNTFRRRGQWRFLNGTLTWSRGEVKTASLSYVVRDHGITLYWRNHNDEPIREHVPLASVTVNYGVRHFFLCPACQRRVMKLYAGSKFYCRHCCNLTYESCQRSHNSFNARLGLSDKQYRNLFRTVEYARELKGRKRVGLRMLRRLNRYIEKSNVRFGGREG